MAAPSKPLADPRAAAPRRKRGKRHGRSASEVHDADRNFPGQGSRHRGPVSDARRLRGRAAAIDYRDVRDGQDWGMKFGARVDEGNRAEENDCCQEGPQAAGHHRSSVARPNSRNMQTSAGKPRFRSSQRGIPPLRAGFQLLRRVVRLTSRKRQPCHTLRVSGIPILLFPWRRPDLRFFLFQSERFSPVRRARVSVHPG